MIWAALSLETSGETSIKRGLIQVLKGWISLFGVERRPEALLSTRSFQKSETVGVRHLVVGGRGLD